MVCELAVQLHIDHRQVHSSSFKPSYDLTYAVAQTFKFNTINSILQVGFQASRPLPMGINQMEIPLASMRVGGASEVFKCDDEAQLLEVEIKYHFSITNALEARA